VHGKKKKEKNKTPIKTLEENRATKAAKRTEK
jgi:hypothetical protein